MYFSVSLTGFDIIKYNLSNSSKLLRYACYLTCWHILTYSRTSQHFREPEVSLSCGPYPEPDRSSPHTILPYLYKIILISSTHLCLGLPSGLFLSGFSTNILQGFLLGPIRATCPAHRILHDFIILLMSGEEYNYEAPHYAIFSNLPLLIYAFI
jgi:hypothetical protein